MKEKITTICRVSGNQDQICNNPLGDSLCNDCPISRNWLIKISNDHPDQHLRLFATPHHLILKEFSHRNAVASVANGVPSFSSPKQP